MKHSSTILQLNEFESIAGLSFRALEGSNHEVRCTVAHLLGRAAAATLTPPKPAQTRAGLSASGTGQAVSAGAGKAASVEEVLGVISTGFLRGGGGFFKGTGEMIKGPTATSREVRVGVTMVIKSLPFLINRITVLILLFKELCGDGATIGLTMAGAPSHDVAAAFVGFSCPTQSCAHARRRSLLASMHHLRPPLVAGQDARREAANSRLQGTGHHHQSADEQHRCAIALNPDTIFHADYL